MTRKALFMIAAAALLLASAFAVLCVFGDESSTASDEPIFGFGGPQAPGPDGMDMHMQGMPEPPDKRAPGQPRYVIDAPDRPDQMPERIIDDYGRMYDEKRALENEGAEVYIFDPELERDAGKELAEAINAVFDGSVVSEIPKGAEKIRADQLPQDHDIIFLELLMDHTNEGSWLRELLSVMISQYVSSESESEGVASSQGRDKDIPEISPEIVKEEDEKEPVSFVEDIPEHTPSSESYLTNHGFDGGTFF